jgi:ankyrin repeat protein
MNAWKICCLSVLLLAGCASKDLALYEAVELGEVGNVERLLEAGADPQAIPDTKVLLPLEMAAQVGIAQVAKSLIKHGAKPDSATSKETPLWIALHYGNGLVAEEIVKGGANYMAPEHNGCTPFHYAILNDEARVVAAMLARGADANAEGCFGRALQVAASKQSEDMLQDLFKAGADPNLPDSLGETAIFSALDHANPAIVRLLLDQGAEIDHQDRDGNTALHHAAIAGKALSTTRALEFHADPDLQNLAGETPLHLAVLHGQTAVVEKLLAAGADPRIKTTYGATPFRIAEERGNGTMMQMISEGEAAFISRPRNP